MQDHGFGMNFSADTACRKWPIAAPGRGKAPVMASVVTVVTALAACFALAAPVFAARRPHPDLFGELFGGRPVKLRGTVHATAAPAAAPVPLPKPRPAEAPSAEPHGPAAAKTAPAGPAAAATPAPTPTPTPTPIPTPAPAAPPQPSMCRLALTEEIAIAPSVPDIHGPGGCGGEDLVRLEAIVLPDKHRVSLKPAATMRCGMATVLADWVRTDIEPLAEGLGSEVSDLDNFDSYDCRGRNGVVGAQLSEHGRANAIDVRGWKLANGQSVELTDRNVPRGLRESVLHSACTRFTTVLGPGSDGYHEDHIHLDLMERHNNYKICQWNVWDPMPPIAPLMPAERPAEAPPRQVADHADKDDEAKPEAKPQNKSEKKSETKPKGSGEPEAAQDDRPDDAEKADSSKSGSSKSGSSKADSSKSESNKSQPDKSATKKRRH
jgi:hypothetical protein